ncbi:MAG: Lrp/AsnC family transcriptional regulator, partial [Bacteroides sp.]|nr:Lrp/AsnC family transcriptional regulator [Bacteroides sp.]
RQLQQNSRLTTKELGAAVNLSTTPTFERMKRLEKEGYIKNYIAVLDADKLNCGFVAFCNIKMKQHTYENSMRIMEAVQSIDEITECYNISGDYDFMLKIYVENMKAYQNFILRILGDIDCIGSLSSSFVLGEVKNSHSIPLI